MVHWHRVSLFVLTTFVACFLQRAFCQQNTGQRLICTGNEFITQLVSIIFDRNRESIARNEPNLIGDRVENIGLFVLERARVYNLSKAFFHGLIRIDCADRHAPGMAVIRAAVQMAEPVFLFDYTLPGHLAYGRVIVTSDVLGQVITLHVPLQFGSRERTLIRDIDFFRADDFKITFTGLGPVTRALSSVLWAAYRVTPQVPLQLYRALALRALQSYVDNNPLPL